MVAFRAIDITSLEQSVLKKIRFYSEKHYSKQNELFVYSSIETIENGFGEKIVKITGNIPIALPVKKGDSFLFISSDQAKYLHGIHRYPAKFFPELPRWLIEKYTQPGEIVLDPFSGSGTTNLESLILGRNSIAVDIEAFCHLLIKVKTTLIDPSLLDGCNRMLINQLQNYNPNLVNKYTLPQFPYRDNWFEEFILYELAYIKSSIELLEVDGHLKDFYLVCFSSIIRGVSNADDGCTRTVIRKKLQKNIFPSMAISKFIESVLVNTFKMGEYYNLISLSDIECKVLAGSDAKSIGIKDESIDCAVTSPPYVNAVDYPRTHQLELYWLGIEQGSLSQLKKKHVGTEVVSVSQYSSFHGFGIDEIDQVLLNLFLVDKRRSYIAYKYLLDMRQNLSEVFRVLKPNKRYIIVVGNNKIRGLAFESWKYLRRLAEEIGFEVETWLSSEVIKHYIKVPRDERISQDYIIVLRKPTLC